MSFTPQTYFISVEYLKDNTPIEESVDDNKLLPFITQSQDIYLQGTIGETGYNWLKKGVTGNTLTNDEREFIINFVQPLVCHYTYYLALPHLLMKTTNKGINKEGSEYSESVDLTELKYLRSSILDMAEFYKKRMVKYLIDHNSKFKWYNNPDPKDNYRKNTKSYFTGVYIPNNNRSSFNNIKTYVEPYGPSSSECNDCI